MKVILLKAVPKLGQIGEVKDVADGYARNYLLLNHLAALVTSSRLADLRAVVLKRERHSQDTDDSLAHAKKRLAGRRFEIKAKASEQGTLFAGVTNHAISAMLKAEGYIIQPAMIDLPHPLKHTGDHEVVIDFGSLGKATIIVEVGAIETI
ncbi:50S ribosomal protein L9 [Candidatus Uhrbacteria bacterium RIFCSPLOWO2_02_FULL_48_12]|uniref:Large ribosomal subunit protein bL9 n=1 Tax=Candidatus Uhrbacteria bacterium RIFCSPLOWO2_02_FULL_48_12 TaxID=1802407 RepID=A0A1F7VA06_9BACT|nr:MAG: 50S ribosomal protein L9 [Candidatus Uhrbacteria bacterium RIFCSPLOWO2_02_FULL_48_12]